MYLYIYIIVCSFNVLVYTLPYLMLLTALFSDVSLYNAGLFLLVYFDLCFCIFITYAMLFVSMLCYRVIDTVCLFQSLLFIVSSDP